MSLTGWDHITVPALLWKLGGLFHCSDLLLLHLYNVDDKGRSEE